MPVDFFGNPILGRQPAPGGPQSLLPDYTPEEQQTRLGDALEGSIGGLGYLGKVLNKTFGGRAVRGALGGHYDELLSVLPLSDTLGLTDEHREVQGTDLLNQLGLTTPGDTGWQNQLAGAGAEIALDPATYLSFGTLTGAGKAAKSAGTLEKNLSGRVRSGQAGLVGLGLPFGPATPLFAGSDAAARVASGGGAALRYPFGKFDQAAKAVTGVEPLDWARRQARAVFDTTVHGTTTPEAQKLASEFYDPLLRQGRAAAEQDYANTGVDLANLLRDKTPDAATEALKGLRLEGEGFGTQAGNVLANAGFAPPEAATIQATGRKLQGEVAPLLAAEQYRGIPVESLDDPVSAYLSRSKQFTGKDPGEGVVNFLRRVGREFSGTHASAEHRLDAFRGFPLGTEGVNAVATNPQLSGAIRTGARQPLDVQNEIGRILNPTGTFTPAPYMLAQANRQAASEAAAAASAGAVPWTAQQVAQRASDLATEAAKADHLARSKSAADIIGNLPEAHQKGAPYFSRDVPSDVLARKLRSVKATTAADTIFEGVKTLAQPVGQFQASATPYVTVPDLLKKLGLTRADPATGVLTAHERAADALVGGGKATGSAQAVVNQLKDHALPADVAADMLKIGKAWQDPRELAPVLQAWDGITNLFKTYVTAVFPAFHARNLVSGIFNQWRDDALNPAAAKSAFDIIRGGSVTPEVAAKLYPGLTPADASQQVLKELAGNRIAFGRTSRQAGQVSGPANNLGPAVAWQNLPAVGGQAKGAGEILGDFAAGFKPQGGSGLKDYANELLNPFNVQGVGNVEDKNRLVAQGRKLGSAVEDWVRSSHYLGRRLAGDTPEQAAAQVMKYQIDYASSNFTEVEKNVLRRAFPWYSYSSRNLPPLLEDLATNPGKVAGSIKLATARQPFDFVPNYIAEGASVPIAGAPDGQQRYFSGFGLPFEDEAVKTLGSLAQGSPRRTLEQLVGMAQPTVKAPLETLANRQFFSGRPLSELEPYQLTKMLGIPEGAGRLVTQAVGDSPAARVASSIDKLIDPRKGTGPTVANLLSGFRIQDVDQERQRLAAARRVLDESLEGRTGVKARQELYVRPEDLQLMDPYELGLYSLYKSVEKQIGDRAKAARQPSGF